MVRPCSKIAEMQHPTEKGRPGANSTVYLLRQSSVRLSLELARGSGRDFSGRFKC